jgi:hypothetical protein
LSSKSLQLDASGNVTPSSSSSGTGGNIFLADYFGGF